MPDPLDFNETHVRIRLANGQEEWWSLERLYTIFYERFDNQLATLLAPVAENMKVRSEKKPVSSSPSEG